MEPKQNPQEQRLHYNQTYEKNLREATRHRQHQQKHQHEAERRFQRAKVAYRKVQELNRRHQKKPPQPLQRPATKHLTPEYTAAIKNAIWKRGKESLRALADRYDVSAATVSKLNKALNKEAAYRNQSPHDSQRFQEVSQGQREQRSNHAEAEHPNEGQFSGHDDRSSPLLDRRNAPDFQDCHLQAALRCLEANNQATLKEIQQALLDETGDEFHISTISKHLNSVGLRSKAITKIGISWNKPEIIEARREWVAKLEEVKSSNLLYIDESPFNTTIRRKSGRAVDAPLKFIPDTRGYNRTLIAGVLYPPKVRLEAQDGFKKQRKEPPKLMPHIIVSQGAVRYQKLSREKRAERRKRRNGKNRGTSAVTYSRSMPAKESIDTESGEAAAKLPLSPTTARSNVARGVTSSHVIQYLEYVAPYIPDNTTLIWDNVSTHVSEQTRTYLDELKERIPGFRVLALPQYSPFLNPIEYLFGGVKAHVRAVEPHTNEDLYHAIDRGMDEAGAPERLEGYWARMKNYIPICAAACALTGKTLDPRRQDDPTGPARKRGQQVRGSRSVVSGDMENVDEGGGESVSSSSTPDAEGGDEDMSTASEDSASGAGMIASSSRLIGTESRMGSSDTTGEFRGESDGHSEMGGPPQEAPSSSRVSKDSRVNDVAMTSELESDQALEEPHLEDPSEGEDVRRREPHEVLARSKGSAKTRKEIEKDSRSSQKRDGNLIFFSGALAALNKAPTESGAGGSSVGDTRRKESMADVTIVQRRKKLHSKKAGSKQKKHNGRPLKLSATPAHGKEKQWPVRAKNIASDRNHPTPQAEVPVQTKNAPSERPSAKAKRKAPSFKSTTKKRRRTSK